MIKKGTNWWRMLQFLPSKINVIQSIWTTFGYTECLRDYLMLQVPETETNWVSGQTFTVQWIISILKILPITFSCNLQLVQQTITILILINTKCLNFFILFSTSFSICTQNLFKYFSSPHCAIWKEVTESVADKRSRLLIKTRNIALKQDRVYVKFTHCKGQWPMTMLLLCYPSSWSYHFNSMISY